MARIQETATLSGKNADVSYAAAERVLTSAGYELIKKRPMAWLLVGRRQGPEGTIDANFAARPGAAAGVTLSVSSEELGEAALKAVAQQILAELAK